MQNKIFFELKKKGMDKRSLIIPFLECLLWLCFIYIFPFNYEAIS